MYNDLVSIIVPIFNTEQYLEKCINSILEQTYKNLEIILVNDGSTDKSAIICDNYAKVDKRIKVFHIENQGLVHARQIGITNAKGVYVSNIDSDDWIENDMIEILVKAIEEEDVDIVCSSHYVNTLVDEKIQYNNISEGVYDIHSIINEILCKDDSFEGAITPYLCSKLFRIEALKMIQITVDKRICCGEDVAVLIPYILQSNKIKIIEYAGYHYFQREGSMIKSINTHEYIKNQVLIFHLYQNIIKSKFSNVLLYQLNLYIKSMILQHQIKWYDKKNDKLILMPYGGIHRKSKVCIYAAGKIGQTFFQYLSESNVEVLGIFDKDYMKYNQLGYEVKNPEKLIEFVEECDYIIISLLNQRIAEMIKTDLIMKGINEEKILCLTTEFLNMDSISNFVNV